MRRLLFVFGLLCIATIMSAQRTYYYKYVKTVDKDGVVSNNGEKGRFYTFTNNTMYESDENGTSIEKNYGLWRFYCRGKVNGCLWFCQQKTFFVRGYQYEWDESSYYLVSEDYATINYVYDDRKSHFKNSLRSYSKVYIRSNPPQAGDDIPGLIR